MKKLILFLFSFLAILLFPDIVFAGPIIPIVGAIAGAYAGGMVGIGVLGTAFAAGLKAAIVGGIMGAMMGVNLMSTFEGMGGPDLPELPTPGIGTSTYRGAQPTVTVEQGTPIGMAIGKVRMAGNIIRTNDPDHASFSQMLILHNDGQSEVTNYKVSRTTYFAYYVNDIEFEEFTGSGPKLWSWSGSTTHEAGVSHMFTTNVTNFRGLGLTELQLRKDDRYKSFQNFNIVGNFGMLHNIGQENGGTKSFTRNPAQILWDWYVRFEGYAASGLSLAAFQTLESYCSEFITTSPLQALYPPGATKETCISTSQHSSQYAPRFAFDKTRSTIGTSAKTGFLALATGSIRINVDMGDKYLFGGLAMQNYHSIGNTVAGAGLKDFLVDGSNDRAVFENTTYINASWTNIGSGTLNEHSASDIEEFQHFNISSNTAYRYFSFRLVNNHGSGSQVGLRDIKMKGRPQRYTFDYVFDSKMSLNDAKKLIWKSFNGGVIQSQGKLTPIWDQGQDTTTHAFTIDNIKKDSLTWGRRRYPNIVRIHFINSHDGFKKDVVELRDEVDIDAKGEIIFEESAWFITESSVARRRCQYKFDKARYQDYFCKLTGGHDSSKVEILDKVTISHPLPGWSSKEFLVSKKSEDEYGRPAFELDAYFAGLYDGYAFEEQENFSARPPYVYDQLSGVTGLALTLDQFFDESGVYVGKYLLTYTPPNGSLYSHSRILLQTHAPGSSAGNFEEYGVDHSSGNNFIINGLQGKYKTGYSVTAMVQAVSVNGIASGVSPKVGTFVNLPDLQTELDALPAEGGRIILPEGRYILTSGVTFPDKNITIVGSSRSSTIIENADGQNAFILYGLSSQYRFENLYFKSQNTAGNYGKIVRIDANNAQENLAECTLQDCKFDLNSTGVTGDTDINSGDIGILCQKMSNVTGSLSVTGKQTVFKGGKLGIWVVSNTGLVTVEDVIAKEQQTGGISLSGRIISTINNTIIDPGIYGMAISGKGLIQGNDVNIGDRSGATVYGIFATGTQNMIIANKIAIHNAHSTGWHVGIYNSASGSTKTNIIGNNVDIVTETNKITLGVYLRGSEGTIENNNFKINNADTNANHYGMLVIDDKNNINSNTMDLINSDATDRGIECALTADNNVVNNNTILNTGVGNGVVMHPSASGNQVSGNKEETTLNIPTIEGSLQREFLSY